MIKLPEVNQAITRGFELDPINSSIPQGDYSMDNSLIADGIGGWRMWDAWQR
jgi:hypothetical protein